MDVVTIAFLKTVLVFVLALVPILNPLGLAPIFLAMTGSASDEVRADMARRIAINAFVMLVLCMVVGSHVLDFFGLSLAVVRVGGGMLVIALIGLVANAIVARQLHGHDGEDLNMRGAYLHILGDLLASVAVIVGAVVIRYTGWTIVDPILSLGIGLLLLSGAGRLVRESLHILMEGVPRGLSVEQIVAAVRELPGVKDLHKVHVWSLCSHIRALAAHLTIDSAYSATAQQVIDDVNTLLRKKFNITHTTLQSECNGCGAAGAICTPVHPGDAVPVHTHAVAAA